MEEIPEPNWTAMANELVENLNDSLSEGFLIGETVMSIRKTIAMVRNPFNLLKTNWREIVGSNTARQLSLAGANCFLEQKYGWKQMYRDSKAISTSMSKLHASLTAPPPKRRFSRYSVKQSTSTGSTCTLMYGTQGHWDNCASDYTYTAGSYGSIVRVKSAGWRADFILGCLQHEECARRYNKYQQVLSAAGAMPHQLLDTIWEIVPYSFVIDWFINPQGIWQLPRIKSRLGQSDVRNIGWSAKYSAGFEVEVALGKNPLYYFASTPWTYKMPSGNLGCLVLSSKPGLYQVYKRVDGLPDLSAVYSAFTASGLSFQQGITGSALILQKLFQ
jgi:hypothetical protein